MKNIIFILITIFGISQITAQTKITRNSDELRQKVHKANPEDNILAALNLDINDYVEDSDISYEKAFKLTNEEDILTMYRGIIEARQKGQISSSVWDNLNVGSIFRGNVNADGSISIEGYIGNMPMPGTDFDMDIGSGVGQNGSTSYADGNYGKNGKGDIENPAGNLGNNGFRGVPGQGHSSSGGDTWNVNATHSSSKNSDGNTTTSFIHHTSSVSNGSGYHSETDKQHHNNGDGTYVTKVHVSQTQADGSNATCDKTTTKDEDGNVKTTITVTKTDSDGNVTSKKTTEKEEDTTDNPMDRIEGGNQPPGPIEMQMAVYRAVTLNSLAGGNTGDTNDPREGANQNSDGNGKVMVNDGSKLGDFEPKTTGGKLKISDPKTNTVNPGVINKKEVKKTIKN
jgi:hypothetical protein